MAIFWDLKVFMNAPNTARYRIKITSMANRSIGLQTNAIIKIQCQEIQENNLFVYFFIFIYFCFWWAWLSSNIFPALSTFCTVNLCAHLETQHV